MYISLLRMLPAAAAAIILIIGLIRIYVRSKKMNRNEFLKIFENTKYIGGMKCLGLASLVLYSCVGSCCCIFADSGILGF